MIAPDSDAEYCALQGGVNNAKSSAASHVARLAMPPNEMLRARLGTARMLDACTSSILDEFAWVVLRKGSDPAIRRSKCSEFAWGWILAAMEMEW